MSKLKLDFDYVATLEEYAASLSRFHSTLRGGYRLALDTETMARTREYELPTNLGETARLSPHTGRPSLLMVMSDRVRPQVFDLVWLKELGYDPEPLIDLLWDAARLYAHRAAFDAAMLRGEWGVEFLNFFDTLQLVQLCGNAQGRKFMLTRKAGLGSVARDLLNVELEGKGTIQRSDWGTSIQYRNLDNPVWVGKLEYAAADVRYLFEIGDILEPLLCDPLPQSPLIRDGVDETHEPGFGMKRVMDLEMGFLTCATELEWWGLPASSKVADRIQTAISEKKDRLAIDLCEALKDYGLRAEPIDIFSEDLVPTLDSLKTLNNPVKMKQILCEKLGLNLKSTQTKVLDRCLDIIGAVGKKVALGEKGEVMEEVTLDFQAANEDEEALIEELERMNEGFFRAGAELLGKFVQYKVCLKLDGMDLRKSINPATGCIHPSVNQLGTATGRLSNSNPNMQQLPARAEFAVELDAVPENGRLYGDMLFLSDSVL